MTKLQKSFQESKITARDIILPPFADEPDIEKAVINRHNTIKQMLDNDNNETTTTGPDHHQQRAAQDSIHVGITPEITTGNLTTMTDKEQSMTIIQQQIGASTADSLGKLASTIYDSYLSTPNFINRLCEISDNLIGLENKHDYLMEQLAVVNKQLPAAVYIPFVN